MGEIICKYCGSNSGFYVCERVTGTATVYYTENGEYNKEQSEDMYTYLVHSGGKKAFCASCDKYIGKSKDLIKIHNSTQHSEKNKK